MVYTQLIDLPTTVRAFVGENFEDGTYTIFINSKLTYEQQREAVRHELIHIYRGDLYKECSVSEIEHSVSNF